MGIVTLILVGLIVGVVAKLLMPGRDPGGFIVTIVGNRWFIHRSIRR